MSLAKQNKMESFNCCHFFHFFHASELAEESWTKMFGLAVYCYWSSWLPVGSFFLPPNIVQGDGILKCLSKLDVLLLLADACFLMRTVYQLNADSLRCSPPHPAFIVSLETEVQSCKALELAFDTRPLLMSLLLLSAISLSTLHV